MEAVQDVDILFRKKVIEYYSIELLTIKNQLGNLRDKTPILEDIRKENKNKIKDLYTVTYKNNQFEDSFRSLVIRQFLTIYNKVINNPVAVFMQDELSKLKLIGIKNSGQIIGFNNSLIYDLNFVQNSSYEDIIELIAKAFVFKMIETYLFLHLYQEYKISERKDELQNLNEHKLGSIKDYEEEEKIINTDFKDFRTKFQQIFSNKKLITDDKTDRNIYHSQSIEITLSDQVIEQQISKIQNKRKSEQSYNKQRIQLPNSITLVNSYIKKLHNLLEKQSLIDIEFEEFKLHFTSESYKPIFWYGDVTELVFLIKELGISNKSIHALTCDHFLNKDGDLFDTKSLASTKIKMKNEYPRIDRILSELKKTS
jgi:hypothetical protein